MSKNKKAKLSAPQWTAIGAIVAAVVGAIALIISTIIQTPPTPPPPTPTSTVTPGSVSTSTATPVPTPTPLFGKPVGDVQSFSIVDKYDPSGHMGDIGDIIIARQSGLLQFTYETQGRGDHEWDWKYKECVPNLAPARFSGVMLLEPPNNWGIIEDGGYDLRGFRTLKWEARSLSGNVYVDFLMGGIVWQWKQDGQTNCWVKVPVPYPDSMPRIPLGIKLLTSQPQSFQYELTDLPEEYFQKVVGGFGWVISWGGNGVELNDMATPPGPVHPRTIVIEVGNIRYEK